MAIDRAKKPEEIDIDEVLTELEHKVERLKILYEQYFMGIEKIEPQTSRKEISRKLIELTQLNMRNTAWRYRTHALQQKFGVYTTYWNRTLREIENGTYYRSVARAGREAARRGVDVPDEILRALPPLQRERILKERERIAALAASREAAQTPAAGAESPAATGETPPVAAATTPPAARPPAPARPRATPAGPADGFDETFDALFDSMTSSGKPAAVTPGRSPAATSPPRPGTLPAGMDEERVRELHRQYVQAQIATGQPSASAVRYEQIRATVIKQGTKILTEHSARGVEFSVILRDGKVILKATPKK